MATVYRQEAVRSRIERSCDECRVVIPAGELHEYTFGIWESEAHHYRTCAPCVEVRADLYADMKDDGSLYDDEIACELAHCNLSDALASQCREVDYALATL
jgi:hypothetical protein